MATANYGYEVILHGSYQGKADLLVMQYCIDEEDPPGDSDQFLDGFLEQISTVTNPFMLALRPMCHTTKVWTHWTLRGFGLSTKVKEYVYPTPISGLSSGDGAPRTDAVSFRSAQPSIGVRRAMHRIGGISENVATNGEITPTIMTSVVLPLAEAFDDDVVVTVSAITVNYWPSSVPRVATITGGRDYPRTAGFAYYPATDWSAAQRVSTQNTRKGNIRTYSSI